MESVLSKKTLPIKFPTFVEFVLFVVQISLPFAA
jgi:hypothetical protein